MPAAAIALGGIALYNAYQASKQQGQANELSDEAISLAREDFEGRAPLRSAFTQGALTPIAEAPDLSSAFASSSSNPFSTGGRPAGVGSQLDFSGALPDGLPPPIMPPSTHQPTPGVDGEPLGGANTPLGSPADLGDRVPGRGEVLDPSGNTSTGAVVDTTGIRHGENVLAGGADFDPVIATGPRTQRRPVGPFGEPLAPPSAPLPPAPPQIQLPALPQIQSSAPLVPPPPPPPPPAARLVDDVAL